MLKRISLLMLSVVFLSTGIALADVATGEPAKDFTLKDTNGQEHSLSGYKGEYVVLEWFNYDCPFVKKHYNSNNMQTLQKETTADGVVWLSINSSVAGKEGHYPDEETNKMAQAKGAAPTAILLDVDGTVGKLYGAQTTPHMFIINPAGTLIYQGAIDDTASADPNDIPKSQNYVRKALAEAKAGQAVSMATTKSYGCSVKY